MPSPIRASDGETISVQVRGEAVRVTAVKSARKSPLLHEAAWSPGCDEAVYSKVQSILKDIEAGGEEKCLEYCREFDKWPASKPTPLLSKAEIEAQIADEFVSPQQKADIRIQLERVTQFAKLQKQHCTEFEVELSPGIRTGQKLVPIDTVGCYVPGGRYSHVSSASMTIATAKAAGCRKIVACSPPMRGTARIQPATLYAMWLAGADAIMCIGGTQAIAAMAFGLFTGGSAADVLVGPGNSFVAEAKRYLYGRVGIDMFAGPTEILVLADEKADPRIIASDLLSQAEHGPTSPAWLITTSMEVAEKVKELCPQLVRELPVGNVAADSWPAYGEILFVETKEDMRRLSDRYAAEHLEVQCEDLDWWLHSLTNYGSLFLGEGTCVTYGDKISGPNHALPTLRASRYTGGLSVDKYIKKLTYQTCSTEGNRLLGPLAARISRMEGMEGHARAADDRMAKYFPGEDFDLGTLFNPLDPAPNAGGA